MTLIKLLKYVSKSVTKTINVSRMTQSLLGHDNSKGVTKSST